MLNDRKIKVLHLEPTDVCQAACPSCARETNLYFDKKQQHHLTMNQILDIVDSEQITLLEKMFMCGNYGDPAAGKHTLDIFKQFRKINSSIVLGMNTNGGLQNKQWWENLAAMLNQNKDYVVFSIDGLEDTNHIYRKNVTWSNVMENAATFINSGGLAHWDMLVYRHNQHQVEECKKFAKKLGFKWFRAKVSSRPVVKHLQLPINWKMSLNNTGTIECHAVKEQSLYIDATGKLRPCCWFGIDKEEKNIKYVSDVAHTWNTADPHPVCKRSCSTLLSGNTVYQNQFIFEEEL